MTENALVELVPLNWDLPLTFLEIRAHFHWNWTACNETPCNRNFRGLKWGYVLVTVYWRQMWFARWSDDWEFCKQQSFGLRKLHVTNIQILLFYLNQIGVKEDFTLYILLLKLRDLIVLLKSKIWSVGLECNIPTGRRGRHFDGNTIVWYKWWHHTRSVLPNCNCSNGHVVHTQSKWTPFHWGVSTHVKAAR